MERMSEYRRFVDVKDAPESKDLRDKPVEELFTEFYGERNGGELPDEGEIALMHFAAELLRNSEAGTDGKYVDPELSNQVLAFLAKEGN